MKVKLMNHNDYKINLQNQLGICKEKDYILEQIQNSLHKMSAITISSLEAKHNPVEIEELNKQLNKLKEEVQFLGQQLSFVGRSIHEYLH